jgi:predicted RNA methylase
MKQLDLFDRQEPEKEITNEPEFKNTAEFDKLMAGLEMLTELADAQNNLIKIMIDDLQKDWTEEEKLQINNPKEYERLQKLKEQENKQPQMAKELTTEAIEVLKNSKIEDTIVKLPPDQLDRKIYLEVKSRLELIGGKWKGGKVQGFVFPEDPSELLEQISNCAIRNLKKEFQYFATPDDLADELVEAAFYAITDSEEDNEDIKISEPSAGQGAIVKAINRYTGGAKDVYCFEAMPTNQTILKKISTVKFLGDDFLSHSGEKFDVIIANPPFSKNQDIDHIRKMWDCLNVGGRIVSVASNHWRLSDNKKETEFRNWINSINADVIDIEAGRFKESGTEIAACYVIIDKRPE